MIWNSIQNSFDFIDLVQSKFLNTFLFYCLLVEKHILIFLYSNSMRFGLILILRNDN